jgi:hypothetical protein
MTSTPCPVCGFDGARLGPKDAAAALRSFPRRFRQILLPVEDDERPDDVLHRRPRTGGLSAIEHALWVATAVTESGEALRLVLIQDQPVVKLPPVEPDRPIEGGVVSAEEAVARIEAAVLPVAARIDDTHGDEWSRQGRLSDGGPTVTALDIAALAVHIGSHHLRATDATISQVAHELPGV